MNVTRIARVTRAALPHLRRSAHPSIVNTCSAVAFVGVRQRALYSASKGAVLALTLAMAADHASEGTRVIAVAPAPLTHRGWRDFSPPPPTTAPLPPRRCAPVNPLGRFVTADEVAAAIASLASPLAAPTTGAILRVDGGMTSLRI